MRSSTACAIFLFLPLLCSTSAAQSTPTAVVRTPIERQRDRVEADLQRRMTDMRALDQKMRPEKPQPPNVPTEQKLSSEERSRILRLRHVAALDVGAYSAFLDQEHTGIFKLFPDYGCMSQKVIRLAGECERYVPLSSSFTFRANAYGDEIYHDIHFKGDRISSNGFFSQGIFGTVGDEPIQNVGLTHPALKFLTSYQADTDAKSVADHAEQLQKGVDADGYRYSDSISPQENVTYTLRVIAYRLKNVLKPLSAETTMNEMMFLSLSFDKRLDVIVVFRILGRDEYGGLTIVWKELVRSDAAKIKFGKDQALRDFRPNQK